MAEQYPSATSSATPAFAGSAESEARWAAVQGLALLRQQIAAFHAAYTPEQIERALSMEEAKVRQEFIRACAGIAPR